MQLTPANFVAKEVVQLKGLGTTGSTLPFEGNRLTVMALPVKCFQDAWPGRSLRNPYKNNVLLMNEGHHLTRPMKAVSASQLDKLRKPVETTFHNNFEVALDFLQTQSIYWLKEIIWDISFSTNYIYVDSDEIEKAPSLTFRNQSLFQDFRKLNLALAELAIIPVVQNSGVHFYILRSEERWSTRVIGLKVWSWGMVQPQFCTTVLAKKENKFVHPIWLFSQHISERYLHWTSLSHRATKGLVNLASEAF